MNARLKLWTIQVAEVLPVLENEGLLTCAWPRVDPDYTRAYRWMSVQMAERGLDPGPNAPVWAWHAWGGARRPRPDLRASGHLPPGTAGVRIEFVAPAEQVVLSDFDGWHAVLNDWYLSESENEAALQENRWPSAQRIERSWARIFDLSFGDPVWRGVPEERSVQACLPCLRRNWICRVDRFTAR